MYYLGFGLLSRSLLSIVRSCSTFPTFCRSILFHVSNFLSFDLVPLSDFLSLITMYYLGFGLLPRFLLSIVRSCSTFLTFYRSVLFHVSNFLSFDLVPLSVVRSCPTFLTFNRSILFHFLTFYRSILFHFLTFYRSVLFHVSNFLSFSLVPLSVVRACPTFLTFSRSILFHFLSIVRSCSTFLTFYRSILFHFLSFDLVPRF